MASSEHHAVKIVCPGCEKRIVEVGSFPCDCGYRPSEPIDRLIDRWQVPEGRQAEVERSILLRQTSRTMGSVLAALAMLAFAVMVRPLLPGLLVEVIPTLPTAENVARLIMVAGMLGVFFLTRSLVTPPLPVGRREAERVPAPKDSPDR